MPRQRRRRAIHLALAIGTIVLGLTIHRGALPVGPVARDVLGDALWAMMIVWMLGTLAPDARLAVRGIAALAICFAVEVSQRYHAPALDAVRGTTLGRLVLGSGFDPRDLAAYAAGVLFAMLLEHLACALAGGPSERSVNDERSAVDRAAGRR